MPGIAIMQSVSKLEKRSSVPDGVPDVLADLIPRCWVPDPSKRQTFKEIIRHLSQMPGDGPLVTPRDM